MKKIILLLVLITSINLSAQDKSYWMCYNFSVEKESEATELVEAIDMLMNADEMAQWSQTSGII